MRKVQVNFEFEEFMVLYLVAMFAETPARMAEFIDWIDGMRQAEGQEPMSTRKRVHLRNCLTSARIKAKAAAESGRG